MNDLTLIVDSREQTPLSFDNLHIRGISSLPTERGTLHTGDYAIKGLESVACWERKAIGDLYGTLIGDHARFKRELERMRTYKYKWLVIECMPAVFARYVNKWRSWDKFNPVICALCKWGAEYGLRIKWCKDRESAAEYVARCAIAVWESEKKKGEQKNDNQKVQN